MKRVAKQITSILLCLIMLASMLPASVFQTEAATSGYGMKKYKSYKFRGIGSGGSMLLYNVSTTGSGGSIPVGEIVYCIELGVELNINGTPYADTPSGSAEYFKNLDPDIQQGLKWVSMYAYHGSNPLNLAWNWPEQDCAARVASQALIWDMVSGVIFKNKTNPKWGDFEPESNWETMKREKTVSIYGQVINETETYGGTPNGYIPARSAEDIAKDVADFKAEYKKLFDQVTHHKTPISFAINISAINGNSITGEKPTYYLDKNNSISLTDTNGALQYCNVTRDFYVYCSVAADKEKLGVDSAGHLTDTSNFSITGNTLTIQASAPLEGYVSIRIAKGGWANDNCDTIFVTGGNDQPTIWKVSDPYSAFFNIQSANCDINIAKTSVLGEVDGIAFRIRNEQMNKLYGNSVADGGGLVTDSTGYIDVDDTVNLLGTVIKPGVEQNYDIVEFHEPGMELINQITVSITDPEGTEKEKAIISTDSYWHMRNGEVIADMGNAGVYDSGDNAGLSYFETSRPLSFGCRAGSGTTSQGVWGLPLIISNNDTVTIEVANGESGNLEITKTVNGESNGNANGWAFHVYADEPSAPTYHHITESSTGASSYSVSGVPYGLAVSNPIIGVYVNDTYWPATGASYYEFTRTSGTSGTLTFCGGIIPESGDTIHIVYKTLDGSSNEPLDTVTTEAIDGVNGKAILKDLMPGTYYVEEVPQAKYQWPGKIQEVTVENNKTASVTFNNISLEIQHSGNLEIVKTINGNTNENTNGWQFRVYQTKPKYPAYDCLQVTGKANTRAYTLYSTNGFSPVIRVYVYQDGQYLYWPDSSSGCESYYSFTRNSTSRATLNFFGSVMPTKDSEIYVVYRTVRGTTSPLYTVTTSQIDGVNGQAILSGLEAGTYYIEEVPQSGFLWPGNMKSVTIQAGASSKVVFNNIPLSEGATLEIRKTMDGASTSSTNNWSFKVYSYKPEHSSFGYVDIPAVTGQSSYEVSGVPDSLAETNPIVDVSAENVSWPDGETENSYSFEQTSSDSGILTFQGATPETGDTIRLIYRTGYADSNTPTYTATTKTRNGENGIALLEHLPAGTYYVEEIPQSGHEWPGQMQEITVEGEQTKTVTFHNFSLKGQISYIKKTVTDPTGTVDGWGFYSDASESEQRYDAIEIVSSGASSYYLILPNYRSLVEVYVGDSLWSQDPSAESHYALGRQSRKFVLTFHGAVVPPTGETITVVYRTTTDSGVFLGKTDANGNLSFTDKTSGGSTVYLEEVPQAGYRYVAPITETIDTGSLNTIVFQNTPLSSRLLIRKAMKDGTTDHLAGWQFAVYTEDNYINVMTEPTAYAMVSHTATDAEFNTGEINLTLPEKDLSQEDGIVALYCNGQVMGEEYDYFVEDDVIYCQRFFEAGDLIQIVYKKYHSGDMDVYTTDDKGYIDIPNLAPGTYYIEELPVPGYITEGTNPRKITVTEHTTATAKFVNKSVIGYSVQKAYEDGSEGSLDGWSYVQYTESLNQPLVYMDSFTCDQFGYWQDVGFENQSDFTYGVYDILAAYVNGVPTTYDSRGNGELILTGNFAEGDEITVVYTTKAIDYSIIGPTDETGMVDRTVSTGTYYIEEIPQYGYQIQQKQIALVTMTVRPSLTFVNVNVPTVLIQKHYADGIDGDLEGIQFAVYTEDNYSHVMAEPTAYAMENYIATAEDCESYFLDYSLMEKNLAQEEDIIALYCNGLLMEDGFDYWVEDDGIQCQAFLKEGDLMQIVYKTYHSGDVDVYTTNADGQIRLLGLNPGETYYIEEIPQPNYIAQKPKAITVPESGIVQMEYVNDMSTLEIKKEYTDGTSGPLDGWSFVTYTDELDHPLVYMDSFTCDQDGMWQDVGFEHQSDFTYGVYDILAVYVNGVPTVYRSQGGHLELGGDFDEGDEITVVYTTASAVPYSVIGPTNAAGVATEDKVQGGKYYIEEIPRYGYEIPEKQTVLVAGQETASVTMKNTPLTYPGAIEIQKENLQGQALEGAHFVLQYRLKGSQQWANAEYTDDTGTMEAGTFYTNQEVKLGDTVLSDEDGMVRFSNLIADGTVEYRIIETKAPAGYTLLPEPIYIGELPIATTLIDKDGVCDWRDKYKYDASDYRIIGLTVYQYTMHYQIVNNDILLPTDTGGNGMPIVTFGSLLMGASVFFMIVLLKRKKVQRQAL